MSVEPISTTPEVEAKVVDGALRAIARFGLAKLTVDDVAREAGISRATLYRYFPGRGAVLAAVAGFGARAFAGHEALQHLLAHEPGAVLPHLCFNGADSLLAVCADRIRPHLCRFMGPLEARRTGEWLARIVLSYGLAPPPDGGIEGAVLGVVREFVTTRERPEVDPLA